jgi:hypothetical protein
MNESHLSLHIPLSKYSAPLYSNSGLGAQYTLGSHRSNHNFAKIDVSNCLMSLYGRSSLQRRNLRILFPDPKLVCVFARMDAKKSPFQIHTADFLFLLVFA